MAYEISTTHTLDGVEVIEGLRVWGYNLDPRIVGPVSYRSPVQPDWPPSPWHVMTDPVTGRRGSDMDPSRMWFRHPSDGRLA